MAERPLNLAVLRPRLNATAMWYRAARPTPGDPGADTRSAELSPAGNLILRTVGEGGIEDLYRPTTFERTAIVDDLLARREAALERLGLIAPSKALLLAGGRVLRCHMDRSDHDGLAGYHSRGLFDEFDIPGHDTWLMLSRTAAGDTLVAWVPGAFLAEAEAAVWASATGCLAWVAEAELR